MLRNESLEEITDGKKYTVNDMAKCDTGGCAGCSKCCEQMADTIVLSPLDVLRIAEHTGKSFKELLDEYIELNIPDGVILPNIKATGGRCGFLSENGRCTIHSARPDFCRLFPLGRLYEDGGFSYILQVHECDHVRSKIKIKKWISTPDYEKNSKFVLRWHDILKAMRNVAADVAPDEYRSLSMKLLEIFYMAPYRNEAEFYDEFSRRADAFEALVYRHLSVRN